MADQQSGRDCHPVNVTDAQKEPPQQEQSASSGDSYQLLSPPMSEPGAVTDWGKVTPATEAIIILPATFVVRPQHSRSPKRLLIVSCLLFLIMLVISTCLYSMLLAKQAAYSGNPYATIANHLSQQNKHQVLDPHSVLTKPSATFPSVAQAGASPIAQPTVVDASAQQSQSISSSSATGPLQLPVTRQVTSTQTQLQVVSATGQGVIAGVQAIASLLFSNYDIHTALQLSAGSLLSNTSGCRAPGLQVVLDTPLYLAPASRATPNATTVPVHVVQAGTIGNIANCGRQHAFVTCVPVSCNQLAWSALNSTPFIGGQDAQTYPFVQQSDIDSTVLVMKNATMKNALAAIPAEMRANEHMLGKPQCQASTVTDHVAGDQVATFIVNIITTCTVMVST